MFNWDEEFSVGVARIDRQHRELFRIGGELVVAMKNISQGLDEYDHVRELLAELSDYTVYHFEAEEELMEKHGFPELDSHQKIHNLFIGRLEDIDLAEMDRDQEKFLNELLNFVADWVENHILQEDARYADYFSGLDQEIN